MFKPSTEGVKLSERTVEAEASALLLPDSKIAPSTIYKAVGLSVLIGLACAILWGIITVKVGYQIGFMAIGVGAAVGFSLRYLGDGQSPIFGYIGAIVAFFGVLIGNVLSVIGFFATELDITLLEAYSVLSFSTIKDVMVEQFTYHDILFLVLAMYEGYKFSFRNLERD